MLIFFSFLCRIKNQSSIDYKDMLFFDDEHRNIQDLNKVGVLSILVEHGVNHQVIQDALEKFTKERS